MFNDEVSFFILGSLFNLKFIVLAAQAADHDAASLFDNDNDIEMATTRSSLEASRPPTSESEGMFDNAGNSGEEEVDEDDTFPLHVSTASRGSKQSKSSQVSFVYILLTLYPISSLSAPASAMLH